MRTDIGGIILAGGQSRRMGGVDKCLLSLGGRSLLERVIERAAGQVPMLALSANGDPARFGDLKMPVLPDNISGFAGPMAGILSGMLWLQRQWPDIHWLASFASDTPFFPEDLVDRLYSAVGCAKVAIPVSGGFPHPVFALWHVDLADDLEAELVSGTERKILAFARRHPVAEVEFDEECFFNINRPEDLERAEQMLGEPAEHASGRPARGAREREE